MTHLLRPALVALATWALSAPAREARADVVLGAEAGVLGVLGSKDGPRNTSGVGLAGRLGYSLPVPVPLLGVTPELKLAVDRLPLEIHATSLRAMLGVRVKTGEGLEPAAFAHVGYGVISASKADVHVDRKGPAISAGVALDITPLSLVSFGLCLSYNRVQASAPAQWVFAGAELMISI